MKYLLLILLLLTLSCASSSDTSITEVPTISTGEEVTLDSISSHLNEVGVPGWLPEDINKDGVVNVLDMIVLAQGVN